MSGKDWNRRAVLAMAAGASTVVVATTLARAQVAVPWSVGTELPMANKDDAVVPRGA